MSARPADPHRAERAYIEAFAGGSQAMITNLRTTVTGLEVGGRLMPVTINDGERGDSYVCLPHSAYSLYAQDEIARLEAPVVRALASILPPLGAALTGASRSSRIVHLGNWMLSTNLHGGWRGEGLEDARCGLAEAFPDHIIGLRSINAWSDANLLERLRDDGWLLLPSRQIYVTDDVVAEWAPTPDARRDLRLFEHTSLVFDDLDVLLPGDAERIAELYAALYLGRYSALNPAFTAAYIAMTHREGVFDYAGLRDADGRLTTVVGCWTRGDVLTTPIVGYDTARPQAEGLYRLACVMLSQKAQGLGVRLNGSAGAAAFKRHRGGRAVLEYWAMDVRHLPWARGVGLRILRRALEEIAVPMMVRMKL